MVDFSFALPNIRQGFTTQQAEVLVKILVQMTNSNMEVVYNDMVTKVQQVRLFQSVLSRNYKSTWLISQTHPPSWDLFSMRSILDIVEGWGKRRNK